MSQPTIDLVVNRLAARIDPIGARIASLVFDDRVELLARAPWSDDDLDGRAMPDSHSEWQRRYRGGWDVLLPHAGYEREVDGVVHGFHGEAGLRRWTVIDHAAASVTLRLRLRTVPLLLERRTDLADGRLTITQSLENFSPDPVDVSWVEHAAWNGALFDDAEVTVAGRPIEIGQAGTASFAVHSVGESPAHDDVETRIEITSPQHDVRISVAFDAARFPFLWVWQERRATDRFPWFRSFDGVGLEPATRPLEPGETLGDVRVDAGARTTSTFTVEVDRPDPPRGPQLATSR